jgi:hypothetical protein
MTSLVGNPQAQVDSLCVGHQWQKSANLLKVVTVSVNTFKHYYPKWAQRVHKKGDNTFNMQKQKGAFD